MNVSYFKDQSSCFLNQAQAFIENSDPNLMGSLKADPNSVSLELVEALDSGWIFSSKKTEETAVIFFYILNALYKGMVRQENLDAWMAIFSAQKQRLVIKYQEEKSFLAIELIQSIGSLVDNYKRALSHNRSLEERIEQIQTLINVHGKNIISLERRTKIFPSVIDREREMINFNKDEKNKLSRKIISLETILKLPSFTRIKYNPFGSEESLIGQQHFDPKKALAFLKSVCQLETLAPNQSWLVDITPAPLLKIEERKSEEGVMASLGHWVYSSAEIQPLREKISLLAYFILLAKSCCQKNEASLKGAYEQLLKQRSGVDQLPEMTIIVLDNLENELNEETIQFLDGWQSLIIFDEYDLFIKPFQYLQGLCRCELERDETYTIVPGSGVEPALEKRKQTYWEAFFGNSSGGVYRVIDSIHANLLSLTEWEEISSPDVQKCFVELKQKIVPELRKKVTGSDSRESSSRIDLIDGLLEKYLKVREIQDSINSFNAYYQQINSLIRYNIPLEYILGSVFQEKLSREELNSLNGEDVAIAYSKGKERASPGELNLF